MLFDDTPNELEVELNLQSFSETVEKQMKSGRYESYLTCVVDVCGDLDIDFDKVGKLLSPALRDKIQVEAEDTGLMVRTSKPMLIL